MAENVGSSDIWSDDVEKNENCRTQTLPLTLLLQKRLLLAPQRNPLLLKRKSLFLLTLIFTNVFVKPNEQNRACSSYAMARKGRMKSKP